MFTLHHAHMVPLKGFEPSKLKATDLQSVVFIHLDYNDMALGARLELATLWLTARCSTIELPKNKCNHFMCGRFEQTSSHCMRYSTIELTHDYCVVYTVRHPWYDKPLTVVYKCRIVTRGGIEPTVIAVK